ncbi:ABC transporter permease subunit [Actinocorallia populi]|uniref:ABC transporter permease subunit n=1 Tax=Actinocorallia populi TaxID=2079200 RepID=UPI000D093798|nr:ABC transporter permease subunit [Actinocorallia populi]
MIWHSWRQFRLQAFVALGVLAVACGYLLKLGLDIRDAHDAALARCGGEDCARALNEFQNRYRDTLLFLAAGLGLVLALIGTFWGAPLVARELENGTHRMVWNQSVTRRRWLAVKLLVTGLAAAVAAGAVSALLTWAASPVDEVSGDRFDTLLFGSRHIVPVSHALLAVVLGTVVGLLVRRTLPAMAITLVAFVAFQFLVPNVIRPHLLPAETTTLAMTADAINRARSLGDISGAPVVGGITLPQAPDAWISGTSPLLTPDGRPLSEARFNGCLDDPARTGAPGTFGDTAVCLGGLDLHLAVSYQPASRYWSFQGLETAFYLAVTALLAAFGLWRIRRLT